MNNTLGNMGLIGGVGAPAQNPTFEQILNDSEIRSELVENALSQIGSKVLDCATKKIENEFKTIRNDSNENQGEETAAKCRELAGRVLEICDQYKNQIPRLQESLQGCLDLALDNLRKSIEASGEMDDDTLKLCERLIKQGAHVKVSTPSEFMEGRFNSRFLQLDLNVEEACRFLKGSLKNFPATQLMMLFACQGFENWTVDDKKQLEDEMVALLKGSELTDLEQLKEVSSDVPFPGFFFVNALEGNLPKVLEILTNRIEFDPSNMREMYTTNLMARFSDQDGVPDEQKQPLPSVEMVKQAIALGLVEMIRKDSENNTFLHLAVMKGESEMADVFINHILNPEQANDDGKTAYDLAIADPSYKMKAVAWRLKPPSQEELNRSLIEEIAGIQILGGQVPPEQLEAIKGLIEHGAFIEEKPNAAAFMNACFLVNKIEMSLKSLEGFIDSSLKGFPAHQLAMKAFLLQKEGVNPEEAKALARRLFAGVQEDLPDLKDINFDNTDLTLPFFVLGGLLKYRLAKEASEYFGLAFPICQEALSAFLSSDFFGEDVVVDDLTKVLIRQDVRVNLFRVMEREVLPLQAIDRALNEGAVDLDATDDNGNNLLHIAIRRGSVELALQLSEAGVNPEHPNNAGETPLSLAQKNPDMKNLVEDMERGKNIKG